MKSLVFLLKKKQQDVVHKNMHSGADTTTEQHKIKNSPTVFAIVEISQLKVVHSFLHQVIKSHLREQFR